MAVRIGITGCMGRMGQTLTAAVLAAEGVVFAGGSEHPASPAVGKNLHHPETSEDLGLKVLANVEALFEVSDVVIDFTAPAALQAHLLAASASGKALVIGTTGLGDADYAAIDGAAQSTAVLQAGNMSLGVNLLVAVCERVAAMLGPDWDAEILEMHHRHKQDAPSGTALMLGEAVAKGRGDTLDALACMVREGITGARPAGEVGFATLRGGGVIGDHSVIFASEKERLEFSHKAEDRSLFADGAIKAASWIAGRSAGRYNMMDVVSLKGDI